jgi:rhodanese-related sulfurtransferase
MNLIVTLGRHFGLQRCWFGVPKSHLVLYSTSPTLSDKTPASMQVLAALNTPLVIDVRDPHEREAGKGGPPPFIPGSINVPLNIDGKKQSVRETTTAEFIAKLQNAGVELSKSKPVITHCGGGGRGNKAAKILRGLGYEAHNGGNTSHIASALGLSLESSSKKNY